MRNIQIFWLALELFAGLFLAGTSTIEFILFQLSGDLNHASNALITAIVSLMAFYLLIKNWVEDQDELHEVK